MNSEVRSDKEEFKKPFHVLHENDFEDEDRAFLRDTQKKGYESKQRGPVLWGPWVKIQLESWCDLRGFWTARMTHK